MGTPSYKNLNLTFILMFFAIAFINCSSEKEIIIDENFELLELNHTINRMIGEAVCSNFRPNPDIKIKSFESIAPHNYPVSAKLIGGEIALISKIVYPELAIRAEIDGIVKIKFNIDKDGFAQNIVLIKDIGCFCGDVAVDALNKVRFYPESIQDIPLDRNYIMSIKFELVL